MAADVRWISAEDGNWYEPSNWDVGRPPTELDDVTLDHANSPLVTLDRQVSSLQSLISQTPLVLRDGSRMTVRAPSLISSSLAVENSHVVATGPNALLKITGSPTLKVASLTAEDGARMRLPEMRHQEAGCDEIFGSFWRAIGNGSRLEFSSLESLVFRTDPLKRCTQRIVAFNGGYTGLPMLQTIDGDISSDGVAMFSGGSGSVLELPALQSAIGVEFYISDEARFEASRLAYVQGGMIQVTDAHLALPSLSEIDSASISVEGSQLVLPSVDTAHNASFGATDGQLSIPALQEMAVSHTSSRYSSRWSASGESGRLDLSNLRTLSSDGSVKVAATQGGRILLNGITNIPDSMDFEFAVQDTGSLIDISNLSTLDGARISARSGGTLLTSSPVELDNVTLTILDGGQINFRQLQTIRSSVLTIDAPLPSVENIDGTDLTQSAYFPNVNHFEALDGAHWSITQGGRMDALQTISTANSTGTLVLRVGPSALNLGSLKTIIGTEENVVQLSTYHAGGGSPRLIAPMLEQVSHTVLRARRGSIVVGGPGFTSFTDSSLVINAGIVLGNVELLSNSELVGSATGSLNGDVVNRGGLISPGTQSIRPQYMGFDNGWPEGDVASLEINGNFQQVSGTLLMHLQGDEPSELRDQLMIGQHAFLGGTLEVQIRGTYEPLLGDTATLIQARRIEQQFDNIVSVGLPNPAWAFAILYDRYSVESRVSLVGDVNFDDRFDSLDLVGVLQAGEYEDGILQNSTWVEGDWNGDGDFTTSDLTFAFQFGHYDFGNRLGEHQVPESANVMAQILPVIWCTRRVLRTRCKA